MNELSFVGLLPATGPKRAEEALRESEARFRELLDSANDAIYIVDAATRRFVMVNRAACAMLGYTAEELLALGPEDIDADPAIIPELMRREGGMPGGRVFEVEHLARDGRRIAVELSVRRTEYDGRPARIAIARNITRRKRMEAELRHAYEKFCTVADFTYDWEYWRSADGRLLWVSPACARISGYAVEEFMAEPNLFADIVHPEDAEKFRSHIEVVDAGSTEQCDMDLRIVSRAGQVVWISHMCRDIRTPGGECLGRRACNRDITERKLLEDKLSLLASTDSLTGVSNRRHFLEHTEREIALCQRHGTDLTLLMLDVDNFKMVNDTYGHAKGDEVLQVLSRVCLDTLRGSDLFGRMGGEEFAAVLVNTSLDAGAEVAERLRANLAAQSVPSDLGPVRFTASIGLAAADREHGSLTDLLKRADKALYQAKGAGRNRVCASRG